MGLVQLLGQFDTKTMQKLLQIEASEHFAQMLSVNIENELMCLLAKQVKVSTINKIKHCKHFAIIMNCTPDLQGISFAHHLVCL